MKSLMVEGKLSNMDGIMFFRQFDTLNRKEYIESMFYTEFTPELFEQIKGSGIDQCKPARVTLTIEQEE